jgi:RNA polymerase sigma-70 factor (ECF subfamily)
MAPTQSPASSNALYGRAVSGDAEAFWELVKPHERLVFAVALGILRDSELAQDVVHDTYVRAFGTLGSLRSPDRLSSWLYGMGRNIAHEVLRKRIRHDKFVAQTTEEPQVVPVADMLIREEEMQALERAIKELPEQHRIVLGLRYMQNLSCKEIASTLDIGLEAAKSRLFEARKALHRRMKAAEHQAAPAPAPSVRGVQAEGGR